MPTVMLFITLLGAQHPFVVMEFPNLTKCLTDGAAIAEYFTGNKTEDKYTVQVSCVYSHSQDKPA